MVSEQLWIGRGPEGSPPSGRVVRCADARGAASEVEAGNTAVVPSAAVARATLRLLGYGDLWVAFALEGGRTPAPGLWDRVLE